MAVGPAEFLTSMIILLLLLAPIVGLARVRYRWKRGEVSPGAARLALAFLVVSVAVLLWRTFARGPSWGGFAWVMLNVAWAYFAREANRAVASGKSG